MFSAKNTALSHEATKATTVNASAPAPNDSGASASTITPVRQPSSAAVPGRTRTDTSKRPITKKSISAFQSSNGRTAYCMESSRMNSSANETPRAVLFIARPGRLPAVEAAPPSRRSVAARARRSTPRRIARASH